ncbi:transporter [Streptomyces uncialis]|uniref:transporter n=1 Tax=Streptomyces uncialis TaxID=1048205 RepID=UPI0037AC7CE8
MIWLTWRQFRVPLLVTLALLGVVAAFLLITGIGMRDGLDEIRAGCAGGCGDSLNEFVRQQQTMVSAVGAALIAVPGLLGMAWGAPLVARELESGTHRMIWNQGVTRTRWLMVRMLAVGGFAVLTTGLLGLMVTWWARPIDAITQERFTPLVFEVRGVVPFGYAAFAFAVGVCAGLLVRRTLPAMAVTLAVVAAAQILVPLAVRPHLMPPETRTLRVAGPAGLEKGITGMGLQSRGSGDNARMDVIVEMAGAWVTSGRSPALTPDGVPATGAEVCADSGPASQGKCLEQAGLRVEVEYQPGDRYWTFQLLETALYLALAGLPAWAGAWWLRRRLS